MELCYEDAELAQAGIDLAQEPNLHAYRYVGSPTWEAYSTVDAVNNTVTAHEVTELGIWGLGIAGNQPTAVSVRSMSVHARNRWLLLPLGLVGLLLGVWLYDRRGRHAEP